MLKRKNVWRAVGVGFTLGLLSLGLVGAGASVGERRVAILLVCPEGCPYRHPQAAVEAAQPNDIIRLWAGRYPGIVFVDQPLTLEGEGTEHTVLEGWIGIIGTRDVTVRGLRVQGGSVRIRKSQGIRLERVRTTKSPIAGIRVEESRDVVLDQVIVRKSRGSGIVVQDGLEVLIAESALEQNGRDGLRVQGESRVTLQNNLFAGNAGCALRAEGSSQLLGEGNRAIDAVHIVKDENCIAARSPISSDVRVEFLGAPSEERRAQAYLGIAGQSIRVRLRVDWDLEGGLLLRAEPLLINITFRLSTDSERNSEGRELGRASWELWGSTAELETELSLPADLFHGGPFRFWRPAYLEAVVEVNGMRRTAVRSGFVLRAAVRTDPPHRVTAVAFSPDGRIVAVAGCARRTEAQGCIAGGIRLISPLTFPPIRAWEAHPGYIRSLAFSPDGELLATASADGVLLWEVATGRRVHTLSHPEAMGIQTVAFHPNGQLLAAGAEDGSVLLWDRFTGQLIGRWEAHPEAVRDLAFSPEGRWLATGSRDTSVKVWEALSGRLVKALRGRLGWILTVAFSPDGRWLALGSRDGTVRLWEWQVDAESSLQAVRTLRGHEGWVRSVVFHPQGRWLASAADDGTILQWQLTGEVARALRGHLSGVEALAFSPDGALLVSGSRDGTVRFWSGF